MADRDISADMLTELGLERNQLIYLLKIEFSDITLYITNAYRDIEFNDPEDGLQTFLASGAALAISDIEETSELQVSSVTIQLSGIDQTNIALILGKKYLDRRVVIYKGSLNTDEQLVASPFMIFDGRMSAPTIEENPDDGKCSVTIECTNHWVDFERVSGRLANHEHFQLYVPGDRFFEATSEGTKYKDVNWYKP